MRRSVLAVVLIAGCAAGAQSQQVHTGASNMGGNLLGAMTTSTVPFVSMPGLNKQGSKGGATQMAPSPVILPPVNPALANSAHTYHADVQGQRSYNQTGVAATAPTLNFTTQWTTNASGQTPDLDTHVLLPAGNAPYTVVNPQNPVGVNTPHRPWPLGSPEFPRNVYYVQPQINFSGGSAKISADVEGINRTVGTCVYGGGACEEVRISSTNATASTLPSGATNVYKQQTYRPIAFPSPPPNASGAGSTYRTYVWASPGIMIDSIKVGGTQVLAASQVVNAFTSPQMSGTLTADTQTSPEIEVTIRNVPVHAEGVREGKIGATKTVLNERKITASVGSREISTRPPLLAISTMWLSRDALRVGGSDRSTEGRAGNLNIATLSEPLPPLNGRLEAFQIEIARLENNRLRFEKDAEVIKTIASFVPFVGQVVAVSEAYREYKEGDYDEAVTEALGAIPIAKGYRVGKQGYSFLATHADDAERFARARFTQVLEQLATQRQRLAALQDKAVAAVRRDANKLTHVLDNAEHELGPMVKSFGGSLALVEQLAKEAQKTIADGSAKVVARGGAGLGEGFEAIVVLGGQVVKVTGNVIDGVVRIGTAFRIK